MQREMNEPAAFALSRRGLLKTAAWGAAGALCAGALPWLSAAEADDSRPNIVIIFTDDQGYGDLGCFGSKTIKTPNLDRMAREGMRFTNFYSAAPLCSPSRAALMTGCYPPRVGITRVLFPRDAIGLESRHKTVAEVLKGRGYATACIGKWHLGHLPKYLPTRRGFDSYLGIPYSNDMTVDVDTKLAADAKLAEGLTAETFKTHKPAKNHVALLRDEEVIEYPVDQATLTGRYTEAAVQFIQANRQRPFFLYLAHSMPHVPLAASAKFKGTSDAGLYGDVIQEIDAGVGRVLDALREAGLEKKTLVLFTSDNGPWLSQGKNGGSAGPLRDGKSTTYEGGMREPCIAWWPGAIPAGTTCDAVASTIDVLPTVAKLAGAPLPDGPIDGKDIGPLLMAKSKESPHEAFYYFHPARLQAVRCGKWKLRRVDGKTELYDLEADLGERNNVADQNADVVIRLSAMMTKFAAEMPAPR